MLRDIRSEYYSDIKIYEDKIENLTMTIVKGGFKRPDCINYMNNFVSLLMERKLYNEYIDWRLNIPQIRVIIEGINDIEFTNMRDYTDVEYYSHDISARDEITGGNINYGTITILRGGLGKIDYIKYLNGIVAKQMRGKKYNQFVEIHLDNYYLRVLIEGINNLPYKTLNEFKTSKGL